MRPKTSGSASPPFFARITRTTRSSSTKRARKTIPRPSFRGFSDPRLQVIFGDGPPPGWLGKPWACARLAEMAKGELLLFVDADVRLAPEALVSAVAALERENIDLLSLLPRQEMPNLGAALHVALIPWSLSSFFPLFCAQTSPGGGRAIPPCSACGLRENRGPRSGARGSFRGPSFGLPGRQGGPSPEAFLFR